MLSVNSNVGANAGMLAMRNAIASKNTAVERLSSGFRINSAADDAAGKAVVGKLDVDQHQEYAAKYGVRNIPTVLLFDKGELVGRQVGVAPKKAYADALDALL